jgi:hypothetical protein
MIIPYTGPKLHVISDSDQVKNQNLPKVGGPQKSSTYRDLRINDLRILFIFCRLISTTPPSVADPDPGSGMGESQHQDPGSGMNNPVHIF